MYLVEEKEAKMEKNGRFYEFFFDQDVYSKIDELVKSGKYNSEKEVIVQAIKNLYERTSAGKTGKREGEFYNWEMKQNDHRH